jgi:coenzyme F420-reducing hydrogenase delta subunit
MTDGRIVVYGCESSGYAAAATARDVGGLAADIDLIRVPCSGRIEVGVLLEAFERGAAGVLVLGCPVDNCKYLSGNVRARKRIARTRRALRDAGIEEERARIELVSSLDAHKVREAVSQMEQAIAGFDGGAVGAGPGRGPGGAQKQSASGGGDRT